MLNADPSFRPVLPERPQPAGLPRRHLLGAMAGAAVLAIPVPLGRFGEPRQGPEAEVRRLHLSHVHTGESLRIAYAGAGGYDAAALRQLDHFLRDWRANRTVAIDRRVIDLLATIQRTFGDAPIRVISGYRTRQTNDLLRRASTDVARNSYHVQGKAVDFTIPGRALSGIREVAIRLRAGGVGYYPGSGFVHLDSGPVRFWSA